MNLKFISKRGEGDARTIKEWVGKLEQMHKNNKADIGR